MADVLGVPVDDLVLADQVGLAGGRAHEPRGLGPVDEGSAAAPAVRVRVHVRLPAHEQAAPVEVGDDVLVRVLHEAAPVGRDGGVECAVGAHRVEHGQALDACRLHVVGAERRRQVHDAGAVVGAHEIGGDDATAGVVEGEVVEGTRVVAADEVAAREARDDLDVVTRARRRHDQVAAPARVAHAHVRDVGSDRGRDVGDERPGRGCPHEQVRVVVDEWEAHVHGRVGDLAVAERHLVGRQRRAAAPAVGDDTATLVEQALVPQPAHQPPDRLDVVVAQGPVRVLGVDPHGRPLGDLGEVPDVALHRLATAVVELGDAVGLDVVLVVEAQLLLDLELDREAVAVPAPLAGNVAPAHGLETRVEVLEHTGPHVVQARAPIGRRRALVEDPRRRALAQVLHLVEEPDLAPVREHLLLERDEVDLRVHRTERHRPTVRAHGRRPVCHIGRE